MKIALFLGAGASVPYGMPTTKDLQDKIKNIGLNFPRKDLLDSDQFPDIEHVLSVLDQLLSFMESRAGELYAKHTTVLPSVNEYAPAAYQLSAERFETYLNDSRTSKEIVEQLITEHYKWDPSNNESAEKILRPFFDFTKSKDGHVTIFTTNYDTVIEEYCGNSDRQIERIDGFNTHAARRTHVWDGKFVPQHDDFPTKVFLYKLHGSMDWLADDYDGHKIIVQKPNTGASGDRARDMYIRPSLDAKDEATTKEPYATILDRFVHALPLFDACIVIGYSFRDPHISEELVKFAGSGKILVLLSPTAISDFENNALKGAPPADEKKEWRGNNTMRVMELGTEGTHGGVCAINESLNIGAVDAIIDAIKSLIKETTSGRKAAAGGR